MVVSKVGPVARALSTPFPPKLRYLEDYRFYAPVFRPIWGNMMRSPGLVAGSLLVGALLHYVMHKA